MDATRRGFVAGASVAAGAAMAVGCAGVAGATEAPAVFETAYDVDVLVVGTGLAGMVAGLRGLELLGDPERVLVIDKATGEGFDFGGSSMLCGGNYLLPTDDTEECKQAYIAAINEVSSGVSDLSLLRVMADNARPVLDWMIENGCVYGDTKDYSAYDCVKQRTMEAPGSPSYLRDTYEARGGRILWNIKAESVRMDAQGACGIVASDADGRYFSIAAKKIILATGGFLGSADLMETYVGDSAGRIVSRTREYITGDGIEMVKAVGGCMAANSHGLGSIYLTCTSTDNIGNGHATRVMPYTIALNAKGQRFYDESLLVNNQVLQAFTHVLFEQPSCKMGMLADAKAAEDLQAGLERFESIGVPVYRYDTIAEAAELFGVSAEVLQATVDEYNAAVVGDHTEGLAPDKTALARTIDTPPFYAFYPFVLSSSLLYSGILADDHGRVLAADRRVIPNLYAAGELIGGCFYDEYFGGSQQCKAAAFGWVAVEHAVAGLA